MLEGFKIKLWDFLTENIFYFYGKKSLKATVPFFKTVIKL